MQKMEKVKGAIMQKMEKVKGAVMQKMEKVKGAVMQKMEHCDLQPLFCQSWLIIDPILGVPNQPIMLLGWPPVWTSQEVLSENSRILWFIIVPN